jgi:hypothetical protein
MIQYRFDTFAALDSETNNDTSTSMSIPLGSNGCDKN